GAMAPLAPSASQISPWFQCLSSVDIAVRLSVAYEFPDVLCAPTKADIQFLQGAATDNDAFVRQRVAAALGELPPEATPDGTVLLKLLGDRDQRVREQAVVALAKRGRPAAKLLLEVLSRTDLHLPLTHKSKELHM